MESKKLLTLVFSVLVIALCAGCPPPPRPVHVANVPRDLSGVYQGTHQINFNITTPTPRAMRPDSQTGPIHVNDGPGSDVQISLRLYENGEPCHLRGQQQGGSGRVVLEPGQRCSLRMLYDGTPVIAGMEVGQGTADFDGYQLRTDITGPFVAEAMVSGRRTSVQGNARITFNGTRQASR